jgi:hypothetical protein
MLRWCQGALSIGLCVTACGHPPSPPEPAATAPTISATPVASASAAAPETEEALPTEAPAAPADALPVEASSSPLVQPPKPSGKYGLGSLGTSPFGDHGQGEYVYGQVSAPVVRYVSVQISGSSTVDKRLARRALDNAKTLAAMTGCLQKWLSRAQHPWPGFLPVRVEINAKRTRVSIPLPFGIKRPCFRRVAEKASYPHPKKGDVELAYKLRMDWPNAPAPLGRH